MIRKSATDFRARAKHLLRVLGGYERQTVLEQYNSIIVSAFEAAAYLKEWNDFVPLVKVSCNLSSYRREPSWEGSIWPLQNRRIIYKSIYM